MLDASQKILDRHTLKEKADLVRKEGRRLVFTNGCFDLLHVGHVRYLQSARKQGDWLVVGVNSDSSVRQLKGPGRPIVPAEQRAEVVAAIGCVDRVTIFDELDPLALIKLLVPDVLVKGADWRSEEIIGATEVEGAGGKVVRVPLEEGVSTSDLIERIRTAASQGK